MFFPWTFEVLRRFFTSRCSNSSYVETEDLKQAPGKDNKKALNVPVDCSVEVDDMAH